MRTLDTEKLNRFIEDNKDRGNIWFIFVGLEEDTTSREEYWSYKEGYKERFYEYSSHWDTPYVEITFKDGTEVTYDWWVESDVGR